MPNALAMLSPKRMAVIDASALLPCLWSGARIPFHPRCSPPDFRGGTGRFMLVSGSKS